MARYCEQVFEPKAFVPDVTPVPVSGKVLGAGEIQNMVDAALDGWLTTGRFNSEFEAKMANFLGVEHALSVNSGSSANLVAFSALTSPKLGDRAISPGDEVITVAPDFYNCEPDHASGAVPVFVDVDIRTHNIDVSAVENAITSSTKAIMSLALGNPFNLDAITSLCGVIIFGWLRIVVTHWGNPMIRKLELLAT